MMPSKQNKTQLSPSERTRLKRAYKRGDYKLQTIYDILAAMPLCHVSYVLDGKPVVTPTLQWREGNRVYWHGSSASRLIRKSEGTDVCMAVSILDGMVMARSAFHHSANYRSAMLFGKATKIEDDAAKEASLKYMMDALFPGRWETLRPMLDKERKATTVLSMPIDEASAKIRSGPPIDDEEDYSLPIWAGVIPLTTNIEALQSDPRNLDGMVAPENLKSFKIG